MAGIFDTTDVGGAMASPVTVKEPIGKVGSDFSRLKGIAGEAVEFALDEETSTDVTPVNDLVQKQLRVSRAVLRGEMTPTQASVIWEKNLNEAITKNPQMDSLDFVKAHKQVMGTQGVGQQALEGTKEFQRKQKLIESAADEQFILPGMTEAQKQEGVNLYVQRESLQRAMEDQKAVIDLRKSQVGLTKSELDLQKTQDQYKSQNLLNAFLSNQRENYRMRAENIAQRVKLPQSNPNSLSKEDALGALDELSFGIQSQLQEVAPFAGGEQISSASKPTLEYISSLREVVSGERELGLVQTEYANRLKQFQVAAIKRDKELFALVGIENMLKQTPINITKTITDKTIELHAKAANGFEETGRIVSELISPAEKENTAQYVRALTDHTRRFLAGKLDDDQIRQLDNHNESVLLTVGSAKNSSAKDLAPLVKYLASPTFGEYVQRRGGLPGESKDAIQVLERQYKGEVIPLVRDEIANRFVGMDTRDYYKVEWIGDNAVFTLSDRMLSAEQSMIAKRELDSINEEVAPHMTRLVNLSANFSGESKKSEFEKLLGMVGLEGGTFQETQEETQEEEPTGEPQLHPEDVEWVKAATTLEEKKRRARALGISAELIKKATRGQ